MRFGRLAVVLGVGLLVAGPAMAQPPGGGPGGPGGGLAGMIGRSKQLQDELKVDKDQADKLTAALAKVRDDLRADTDKLRDRNTPAEEREMIGKKVSEANEKALETVLKPEQIKRLHQIENQQAGLGVFNKEDVQAALKLTDEQKEKIKAISDDLRNDLRAVSPGGVGGPGGRGGRGGADPDAAKKREGMQKEAMDGVKRFLSASQKEALKDLVGEPFALSQEGFGPGGGPGGSGGGPGGRGGPGGFGAPSPPGQVMSSFVQDTLKLTPEQKQRMEQLQKEVDSQIDKILTEEQKKQFKEMQQGGGRGGPGGGRGRGPGGDGGKPPQKPQ
jgi:Spy/CpxP family protein refolding chaperone